MPKVFFIILFVFATFLTGLSQVLMKYGVNKARKRHVIPINMFVFAAYALLICTTLLTVYSMQEISVLLANALLPSSYIFTILFSYLILKERIEVEKIFAIGVIVMGILITVI